MEKLVVGFDGSKPALEALRWAAEEAEHRSAEVQLIDCWREPILDDRPWVEVWDDPDGLRKQVLADLAAVTDAIAQEHPGVPFSAVLHGGRPDDVLVEAAEEASLTVVGARGRGGFSGLLLGSVSQRVASSASSTVVVVRGSWEPKGEVVVGVDGSASSRLALAWSANEARLRGTRLRIVMAWSYLLPEGERGPEPLRAGYTAADARLVLRSIVRDVLGPAPEVDVELEAPCELAARALIQRADNAALLVIGPRDPAGRHRTDLGSVAAQLLHHAPCPLAIVRPADDRAGSAPGGRPVAQRSGDPSDGVHKPVHRLSPR